MTALQNLAVFFLACQLGAAILLFMAYLIAPDSFRQIEFRGHPAIPGFGKIIKLFRNAWHPAVLTCSFLSLVFVVLSYVGVLMMVIQLIRILAGVD